MPSAEAYSPRFDRALVLAAIVHSPQVRKGTSVPYVIHPVHVAAIARRHGYGKDVELAALLHDVIEDVKPHEREMRKRLASTFDRLSEEIPDPQLKSALGDFIGHEFGARVRSLVKGMTQDKKRENGEEIPRAERHAKVIEMLRSSQDNELIALKASDALHNTQSIVADLDAKGLEMMSRFNGPPDETVKYYRDIGRVVGAKLGSHPLAAELAGALDELMRTLEKLRRDLEKVESIARE